MADRNKSPLKKSAAQWTKICLDFEVDLAAVLKAISRLSESRGKLALAAKLGDADAQAQLNDSRTAEVKRQLEADDLHAALQDAREHLAAAQAKEKSRALNKLADEIDDAITIHSRRAGEVDRRMKLLGKELTRWLASARDLAALTGDKRGIVSRRNAPGLQLSAIYHHGLDKFFAVESRPLGTHGMRSFADVDKRLRSQVKHAAALMRHDANPESAPPAEPENEPESDETPAADQPRLVAVGE